jgi:aminopeptidase N
MRSMMLITLIALQSFPCYPQEKPECWIQKTNFMINSELPDDNPIDVFHYNIHLNVLPEEELIFAQANLDLCILDSNQNSFYLNFVGLKIDSIFINMKKVEILYNGKKLFFNLTNNKDTTKVQIYYHGHPQNDGFGGFFFSNRFIYTIGQGIYTNPPSMLRYWIPSHDVPNDKATLEMYINVPKEFQAISNGLLQSVNFQTETQKSNYYWYERHPISPYLIGIAIGNFAQFNKKMISVTGDTIPIEFYIYHEDKEKALEDWKNVPGMLSEFEKIFTSYPFDRYSMVELPNRGAMEHQTMTSFSSMMIQGNHQYENIVAHELAHHWFGNLVTITDWKDLWLNEAFATYSEALYFEALNGRDYLKHYMDEMRTIYLKEVNRLGSFSIYDPRYLWSATVYQKGAWVLHMLRWSMGDQEFFTAIREYIDRFAFGNVTTKDFVQIMQEHSHIKLDWFFDQWLYQSGHPDLALSWQIEEKMKKEYVIHLHVVQTQKGSVFKLPAEIMIKSASTSTFALDTVQIDQRESDFIFKSSDLPEALIFDPSNWLLKEYKTVSIPSKDHFTVGKFALGNSYPNPFYPLMGQSFTTIHFQVAENGSPQPVTLAIYNILGQSERIIIEGIKTAGEYTCEWDGRDANGNLVPSGIYFYRLQSEKQNISKKLLLIDR